MYVQVTQRFLASAADADSTCCTQYSVALWSRGGS
jgi:hypothetical protein